MRCPRCSEPNPPERLECARCGETLLDALDETGVSHPPSVTEIPPATIQPSRPDPTLVPNATTPSMSDVPTPGATGSIMLDSRSWSSSPRPVTLPAAGSLTGEL